MYFPYLRGRQFELLALRELVEQNCINDKVVPILEPIKPTTTLNKTIETFTHNQKDLALVFNPAVGDFVKTLREKSSEKTIKDLNELLSNNQKVIRSFIMNGRCAKRIKDRGEKTQYLIINTSRDCLDDFLEVYGERDEWPRFALIPDDRAFKRIVPGSHKVLLEDKFNKQLRNIDYLETEDEFFSDTHLYYQEDGFIGFSDYSVVGEEFSESGFAPVAVAIHIVYFTENKELRIHHFVSDTNDGIDDPAGKFGEALKKLVQWCDAHKIKRTLGLQGFYDCYKSGKYPGLGMVKKYSIMHHLELMSDFLGGVL